MDIKETGKKLKPFAPVLSVALVTACVAGSLSGYEAPVYAATQEETPVKKEETKEKEVKEIFLHPDQMYHTTNRGPMITHVNALQYITWKDGIWQFTSESLESIALRLSRYYGVDIHCDEKTAVKSCTGKLILFDDVDKTLRIIEEIFGVRYETNQNEIIISMNP